ncbi:hypothetical protein PLESTB_000552100 [Pleodorina starrii]|uniref:BTB domain-containing protein n=1 Tax=Pleodorina starrii TaxID=330485 RepID=A0A9W6BGJ6_9CHLO|nr:hypothetical protein PLESTB_000552100 [Pleodorina starrii]GLC69534.1 hypothetical protein PLESTF_000842700 [Pleodorina starrii]
MKTRKRSRGDEAQQHGGKASGTGQVLELDGKAAPPEPDLVLRLNDGKELRVHSYILRLVSPVLCVMLNGSATAIDLPDDKLPAWELLWQNILPGASNSFFDDNMSNRNFEEEVSLMREVLGLAHKYGMQESVRQTCKHVHRCLVGVLTDPDEPPIQEGELRSAILWMDTLLSLGLDEQYGILYRILICSDKLTRRNVSAVVRIIQDGQPQGAWLHPKLLTDLVLSEMPADEPPRPQANADSWDGFADDLNYRRHFLAEGPEYGAAVLGLPGYGQDFAGIGSDYELSSESDSSDSDSDSSDTDSD